MTLEKLSEQEIQQYFELYINYCEQRGQETSMKDFTIWFEEQYGEV